MISIFDHILSNIKKVYPFQFVFLPQTKLACTNP